MMAEILLGLSALDSISSLLFSKSWLEERRRRQLLDARDTRITRLPMDDWIGRRARKGMTPGAQKRAQWMVTGLRGLVNTKAFEHLAIGLFNKHSSWAIVREDARRKYCNTRIVW